MARSRATYVAFPADPIRVSTHDELKTWDVTTRAVASPSSKSLHPLKDQKKRHLSEVVGAQGSKRLNIDPSNVVDETYCHECGITFSRPYTFRRHVKDIHEDATIWRCNHDGCCKSFKRKDILDRHSNMQHGSGKVICTNCTNFVRKDGLPEHLATKACRDARLRKLDRSQVPARLTDSLPAYDGVRNSSHQRSRQAAPLQQSEDKSADMYRVDSLMTDSQKEPSPKVVEPAGTYGSALIDKASLSLIEVKAIEHEPATTVNGTPTFDAVKHSPLLPVPYIVADSPRQVIPNHSLEELFLVDDTSVVRLAEDVEQKRLMLEKTVAMVQSSGQDFRPCDRRKLPRTIARPQTFYDMDVGAACALCTEDLGNNLQSILDHARSHEHSRHLHSFKCKTCNIEFAFKVDFELHSSKLQTWSLSRELPPVDLQDPSDWVAMACAEAREAFISLLRSWENLQFHWYLVAIKKLSERDAIRTINSAPEWSSPSPLPVEHQAFGQAGLAKARTWVRRHISMEALIQTFSKTSLTVDNLRGDRALRRRTES